MFLFCEFISFYQIQRFNFFGPILQLYGLKLSNFLFTNIGQDLHNSSKLQKDQYWWSQLSHIKEIVQQNNIDYDIYLSLPSNRADISISLDALCLSHSLSLSLSLSLSVSPLDSIHCLHRDNKCKISGRPTLVWLTCRDPLVKVVYMFVLTSAAVLSMSCSSNLNSLWDGS